MKPDDIKTAPKVFCESINLAYTPEYFVMGLATGNQATLYAMTPQHAKRLRQYLDHQLNEYEQEHGEITAEWKPNIISPVQRANPPREGS